MARFEVVEDSVSVLLAHSRVNEVARVAEIRDLASEKLNPLGRITENDRLVDLQLRGGRYRYHFN